MATTTVFKLSLLSGVTFFLLLSLFQKTSSYPYLHNVNDFDVNGNTCPLPSFLNTPCPLLCAESISSCPPNLQPKCQDRTHIYCGDGYCHPNPGNESSLIVCARHKSTFQCSCPESLDTSFTRFSSWIPCNPNPPVFDKLSSGTQSSQGPSLFVNVSNISTSEKISKTFEVCSAAINTTVLDFALGSVNSTSLSWVTCPSPTPPSSFTLSEPFWVIFFLIFAAEAVLLISWISIKKVAEISQRKSQQSWEDRKSTKVPFVRKDCSGLTFSYHRSHHIGNLLYATFPIIGAYLYSLLIVVILDYYSFLPVASAPGSTRFFYSDDLMAFTFVLIWHVAVIWVVMLKLLRDERIRKWCWLACPDPINAEHVCVEEVIAIDTIGSSDSRLLKAVAHVERILDRYFRFSTRITLLPIKRTSSLKVPFFSYSSTRYVYDSSHKSFGVHRPDIIPPDSTFLRYLQTGLSSKEAITRVETVGPNRIEVTIDSVWEAVVRECSGWLYIYQGSCLLVWVYFAYWQMGTLLSLVIILSTGVKIYTIQKSQRRLRDLAMHSDLSEVLVYRSSCWVTVHPDNLVPGDIIAIPNSNTTKIPVDAILLRGEMVINEAGLTGESMPIRKLPIDESKYQYLKAIDTIHDYCKQNIVHAGTELLQARSTHTNSTVPYPPSVEHAAILLTLSTGTSTTRGSLVKSILHPLPLKFIFQTQLKIVYCILVLYGIFAFTVVIVEMGHGSVTTGWFYALFTISEVLNPILPAVLIAGQSVASTRLSKVHDIFCVDLQRITVSGKIKIFCFDKTGTLTKENLEMYGVLKPSQQLMSDNSLSSPPRSPIKPANSTIDFVHQPGTTPTTQVDYSEMSTDNIHSNSSKSSFECVFTDVIESFTGIEDQTLQLGIASCHEVSKVVVGGNDGYVGNPVDVEMFKWTGYEILHGSATNPFDSDDNSSSADNNQKFDEVVNNSSGDRILVLKRFEFLHARQCMAVIVKHYNESHSQPTANDNNEQDYFDVYVKGSFERIKKLTVSDQDFSKFLPTNYDATTARLAKEGGYVLAIGCKRVHGTRKELMEMLNNWSRDEIEHGIRIAGLIVFRNNLKHDTTAAINELKKGSIRTVMVTGDNAYTGIYIARQCGMISRLEPTSSVIPLRTASKSCMLPDAVNSSLSSGVVPVMLGDLESVEEDLKINGAPTGDASLKKRRDRVMWRNFDTEEVVAFETILDMLKWKNLMPVELAVTGKAFNKLIETGEISDILLDIRVFSRMSPSDKVECLELHKAKGITGMCGDGGNDVGALRVAHAGIALSEAEASIAAPFSSKTLSVHSCVDLVCEGRAALATSFACYKFLVMYGLTISSQAFITYYFSIVLPQWVWIYMDGITVISTSYLLTFAIPKSKLYPIRPTSRLLGPQTVLSVVIQAFINFIFLLAAVILLFRQGWFLCNEFDGNAIDLSRWWLLGDNYESAVIGPLAVIQLVNAGATFNFGHKYRRAFYRNYMYTVVYIILLVIPFIWVLSDPSPLTCWFRINCGSPDVLEILGYPRPNWSIPDYNSPLGHNVLPRSFRTILAVLMALNVVVDLTIEKIGVLGYVREWLRRKWMREESIMTL